MFAVGLCRMALRWDVYANVGRARLFTRTLWPVGFTSLGVCGCAHVCLVTPAIAG